MAAAFRVARNNPGRKWEVRIKRAGVSATVWDTLTFDLENGSWHDGKRLSPDLGAPYWRAFRTGKEAVAAIMDRLPPDYVARKSAHGWRIDC